MSGYLFVARALCETSRLFWNRNRNADAVTIWKSRSWARHLPRLSAQYTTLPATTMLPEITALPAVTAPMTTSIEAHSLPLHEAK